MTFTKTVMDELFEVTSANGRQLIRMPQRFSACSRGGTRKVSTIGWWTAVEHEKFLEAMELYPSGPWMKIARHVGSKTSRQVMTHAQKYRQRIKRQANRKARVKSKSKTESSQVEDTSTRYLPTASTASSDDISEVTTTTPSVDILPEEEVIELDPSRSLAAAGELSKESDKEVPSLDDLLLMDELLQLDYPRSCQNEQTQGPPQPEFLTGNELMDLLLDPVFDVRCWI